ncbi:MAG: carboxylating nicotinate-nucleotide diphosphorylase [Gammaproteobacteria bacterium]|nr:carboxylating nicotinate-nucleotide diphosphorylase [Gammaproteobacteria bacterium]MCP4091041.1 carboxylating nicotinate-nucleotide diphosphorylase [Gammaproteobacteria bacterium]MCP4277433.1 carboxylating nicotinate-nucleotide diphosphorylase [Gammaproteobacteria bacterium]MCP4831506.1 carboxylating nicotinate-nucleotide diphosphorylase [Gammaproteobacteria bacterium]MCP4927729.1 carboxylating nicotinate-nucleotide diphosphorylase [Gammaproteobacteria bacterium]
MVTDINLELKNRIAEDVRNALTEDIGSGDLTAQLVPEEQWAHARLTLREDAVLCGIDWFNEVFAQLGNKVVIQWHIADGDLIKAGSPLCELEGPARTLLTGERTAMNFLQTLSATATATRAFCMAIENTKTVILDTRKTLPGLRLAQKYAVRTGGAQNHRTGLFDGVLIKENHIYASGGIDKAVAAALAQDSNVMIEVEVESLDEARAAIKAGAHRLLLDNFNTEQMRDAVDLRNQLNEAVGLEASGNVSLNTVQDIAETGVDFISIGTLTKDVRAVDLSMRFEMA